MERFRTVEWSDGVGSYDARGNYVELCWGPILGPSALVILRRLAFLAGLAGGVEIDLGELSVGVGLGRGTGKDSRVVRALGRLEYRDLIHWQGAATLAVRCRVPRLPGHLAGRLTGISGEYHWASRLD